MRKISAMYKYSGGTDYRHTCYECKNCIKVGKGNKSVYKCLAYGNTSSTATDWKISYIACKHFNDPLPERPVIEGTKRQQEPEEFPGQMSIEDYLEGTL